MYTYNYPHPAVTADCLVFARTDEGMKLLLIQRKNEPCKGKWAFPGGFMDIDETTIDAARRELKEETVIHVNVSSPWLITRFLTNLQKSAVWMMLHKQSGSP